jgi:hypothetical protein
MGKLATSLFALAAFNTTTILCMALTVGRTPDALDVLIMLWVWPLAFGKLALERR